MSSAPPPAMLSVAQARVLGVLVEKEHTVPDTYPLSLKALVAGCNQKNNRDPVLELTESEVQSALDELKRQTLVIESGGARVQRYSHNLARVLGIARPAEALLAVLFLRGPQTAGELRIGSERLHRFSDISSVEAFLEELAARPAERGGALVARLERAPSERENRWAHLLSGPVSPAGAAPRASAHAAGDGGTKDALDEIRAQLAELADEVAELRRTVAALKQTAP